MSRPRFLADHDLNEHIIDGVARREPGLECVRVRDLSLDSAPDGQVLSEVPEDHEREHFSSRPSLREGRRILLPLRRADHLGRHRLPFVVVCAGDGEVERTLLRLARHQRGLLAVATLDRGRERTEIETALDLPPLLAVAGQAFFHENRADLGEGGSFAGWVWLLGLQRRT